MTKLTIENLIKSGVHYGNLINKWNPKMAPYIYGVRNSLHIIDLEQTVISLRKVSQLIEEISNNGGRVLFIGTDDVSSNCVRYFGRKYNQYYLHKKWFGGLFTNWNHFSQYLSNFNILEREIQEGKITNTRELKKYRRLALSLEGIRNMKQLPNIVFICNTKDHAITIKEANQMNIPVVSIVDTDCNPDGIDYVIPANDDNITSIKTICEIIGLSFDSR